MHGIIGLYRHIGRTGLGWIDGQKSPVFRRGKSGNPSRSCRRGTSSTRYVTHIVLDTKVDAQCDKLATVVSRTKSTTLAIRVRFL